MDPAVNLLSVSASGISGNNLVVEPRSDFTWYNFMLTFSFFKE